MMADRIMNHYQLNSWREFWFRINVEIHLTTQKWAGHTHTKHMKYHEQLALARARGKEVKE